MTNRVWHCLASGLIAYSLFFPSTANARGIVLITRGESIDQVGDVSPEVRRTEGDIKIGYKYGYWGAFWVNLWTYGGTYCVYQGDRYNPIEPAVAARLLGKRQDELSPPFLYRVPLGWLILGPLIVTWIILSSLDKRSGEKISSLFQDPRYGKALEILNAEYAKQPAAAAPAPGAESQATTHDRNRFHAAFEAGVQHLVDLGIPRQEAERNLATMVQVFVQAQQQQAGAPGDSRPA